MYKFSTLYKMFSYLLTELEIFGCVLGPTSPSCLTRWGRGDTAPYPRRTCRRSTPYQVSLTTSSAPIWAAIFKFNSLGRWWQHWGVHFEHAGKSNSLWVFRRGQGEVVCCNKPEVENLVRPSLYMYFQNLFILEFKMSRTDNSHWVINLKILLGKAYQF